jgi:hypothetical protein
VTSARKAKAPVEGAQASFAGDTLYCSQHGRWIIWQGGHRQEHQRPCPECPTPTRSSYWVPDPHGGYREAHDQLGRPWMESR